MRLINTCSIATPHSGDCHTLLIVVVKCLYDIILTLLVKANRSPEKEALEEAVTGSDEKRMAS